jgi:hypothetical protein
MFSRQEKKEKGVMVIKNGKAWAKTYSDGHSTEYGWVDTVDGEIHNPDTCKLPTDVTYKDSPYFDNLKTAKLCEVERTIIVVVDA